MAYAEMAGAPAIHVMATADRTSTTTPFPTLAARPDLVVAEFPFITEDCLRYYMTGLDAVFYVNPQ